jgi:hypothetical protein
MPSDGNTAQATRIAVACAQNAYTSLDAIAWEDVKVLLALQHMQHVPQAVKERFETRHALLKVLLHCLIQLEEFSLFDLYNKACHDL